VRTIAASKKMCSGDAVVQVKDIVVNGRLGKWYLRLVNALMSQSPSRTSGTSDSLKQVQMDETTVTC
jgi:hypothetical protein